ncbi:MAG TPA: aldolase/citrate lyase family protein, partial [Nitrospiraceae bacterium]|nr:aldolase/citrate lyase family protein [Nitrospiraceae bacterium]
GHLEEIAAVPGVDALFVGPGDLAASMGYVGEMDRPEVQSTIADAARRARKIGKSIGIVGANPDVVRSYLEYGFTFAAVASDIAMMTGRAVEWRAALTGQAPAVTTSAAY